jgi:DNA-binding MarR family transcriptional regulator
MQPEEQIVSPTEEVEQETHWLTPVELRTWMAFWGAIRVVKVALDRGLRAVSDLSLNDYQILAILSNAPLHQLRMSDLATVVFESRSRLTYQITQLERAGLVRREDCLTDKRGALAVLTPHGMEVMRTVAPKHLASIRDIFFNHLTAEQVTALGDALWAIVAGQGEATTLEWVIERELTHDSV